MERVQLVDRPGSFFVVNRSLGAVRLLEGDREFTVPEAQVKRSVVKERTVSRPRHNPRIDYDVSYPDLMRYLKSHWNQLQVYFRVPEKLVPWVCNKHLELTGEELKPELVTLKKDPNDWPRPTLVVEFPGMTNVASPSKIIPCGTSWQRISNNTFIWWLIEKHGLRKR